MAAQLIGLGLEIWSVREDKDYQTRQAQFHVGCHGAGVQ